MNNPRERIRGRGSALSGATIFGLTMALAAGSVAVAAPSAKAPIPAISADGTLATQAVREAGVTDAVDKAKATGSAVEIAAERTEDGKTFANPDGTFRRDTYLRPVHVRQNGRFVDADDTLVAGKDGTVRPKAARADYTFSGGGEKAPLATVTKDGRAIALTWPGKLPKPALAGDTATYAEVLPGVDLKIVADVDSFSHVLVVKTPEAARNPKLARLEFGLKAKGLEIKAAEDGSLTAVNPAGQAVFTAPPPKMWDSTGTSQPEGVSRQAGGSGQPAPTAAPVAGVAAGASDSGKQAELAVRLSGDRLDLGVDQTLLTAPDTVFPVVIDPVWRDDYKNLWAIAYKHNAYPSTPTTTYINGGTLSKEARVGCAKDQDAGYAVVCAKTFFHIPTRAVWGKQVIESTLRIRQTYAGSHSCQSGEIEVWDTGRIQENTTWGNQPAWYTRIDSSGQSFGGRACPGGDGIVEFNVTAATRSAATNQWDFWAFGLKSKSDTVDVSWRRFAPETAVISTSYNTPPATPYDRSTDPSVPCTGAGFGLTDYVTLRARVDDEEDNNVSAEFHYWKDGIPQPIAQTTQVVRGNVASVRIPVSGLTNGTYVWDVRAYDGRDYSPWAGQCRFTIDKQRPGEQPTVASTEFPNGDGGLWGAPARTPGTFTFGANGVSDVVRYEWYTEFDLTPRQAAAQAPGGPASVTATPLRAGPHTMYVTSIDAAGNRSDTRTYLFYATRSANRDKPGDVNGDGFTDLWVIDKDGGQLRMHPGDGTGTFGASVEADKATHITASITNRGDWGEDGYEDLILLERGPDGQPGIFRRANAGSGILENRDTGQAQFRLYSSANKHWQNGGQVLSLGSVNDDAGPGGAGPDGVVDDSDWADLLVLSDGRLWLYYGSKGTFLDELQDAVQIGDASWAGKTIMTPGDTTGDGLPDLWVRDDATGDVHEYPSAKDANGNFDPGSYASAATRTKIASGITAAAYPRLTSNGDLENAVGTAGHPDLWGVTPEGRVVEFPGKARVGDSAFGPVRDLVVNSRTWNDCQTFTSADTGTHSLCGPILTKYLALGGPTGALRYPTTDVTAAGDATGRYAHFQGTRTAADPYASIYWSPGTGAWSVVGAIRGKWASLGWEQGFLGYPTSDETPGSASYEGRISTFAGAGGEGPGAITYAPDAGTHEIHGLIYQRFIALGGTRQVGYASTDETATPVKYGRYNHFRMPGATSETSSIYYSPNSGTWQVLGGNRSKWAELGSENGWLGFPTSNEYQVANGWRADFEGGYLRWNSANQTSTAYQKNQESGGLRVTLDGDFNGDGRADIATVMDHGNCAAGMWTQLGNADGTFASPFVSWTNQVGYWCVGSAKYVTGDFNGDGRDDIAAMYDYGNGSVKLHTKLARADGGFVDGPLSWEQTSGWDYGRTTLMAGDQDGDGRSDLIAAYGFADGRVKFLTFPSRTDGGFTAPVTGWEEANPGWWYYESARYTTGDFNGDGKTDIAAAYVYSDGTPTVFTLTAGPNRTFAAPASNWTAAGAGWDRASVQIKGGDTNGDGRADLVMLYTPPNAPVTVTTWVADATGKLASPSASPATGQSGWTADRARALTGDVDGDGRTDLYTVYARPEGGWTAYTFRAQPDGTLAVGAKSWEAALGTW
ncbi:FG-GAP-like repeat-containing protein [Uniformispora flossi]|uniref:FG-GAP-like repeat-containing protein n=1 Tax=Uniformispora flossi TaxID=3390723 RepID=UPI003C2DC4BA